MGLLALGLTGCGGGGSEGTPVTPANPIPTQTIPAPPANTGAVFTAPVAVGQGATLTASNLDPAVTGGVTGVSVTVNPGSINQDATFGIAVRPKAESVIANAQKSGKLQNVTSIAEFTFGPVGPDGKIDASRPIVFSGTMKLTLTPDQFNQLWDDIANGYVPALSYIGTDGQLHSISLPDGSLLDFFSHTVSFQVDNIFWGEIQFSVVKVHAQGGITP
jgi:hypothetical protein